MKKNILFPLILLCGLLSVSCSNKDPIYVPITPEGGEPGEPGEPSDPVDPVEAETFKVTLDFSKYEFEGGSKETTNSSVGDNHIIQTIGKFLYASDDSGEDVEITAINVPESYEGYIGIKKLEYDAGTGIDPFTIFQISSGTQSGYMNITLTHKIVSVKITAQGYYKAFVTKDYSDPNSEYYTAYSVDLDTTFKVNGESWELKGAEYDEEGYLQMPPIETKEFELGTTEFSISDDDYLGRIFIHSIEFTLEK